MNNLLYIISLTTLLISSALTAQEIDSTSQALKLAQDSIDLPKVVKKSKIPKPPMVNRERAIKKGFYIDIIGNMGMSDAFLNDINWNYGVNRGIRDSGIKGGSGLSWAGGVELDFYFSGNVGIGIGAHYNSIKGSLDIRDFEARYYSDYYNIEGEYLDYERIVSIKELTENYTLTQFNFPILLKLKTDVSYRMGVFAHLGGMYNLPLKTRTIIGDGTIDYQAIYYSDDGINYGYGDGNINEYTLQLTEEYFFSLSQNVAADELHLNNHFDQDALNIGLDINPRNMDEEIKIATHFSVLARIGLMYNISEKISLWVSGQYVYGLPFVGNSYILTDKIMGEGSNKYGEYHSLLNGGARYSTLGGNLGLSIGF